MKKIVKYLLAMLVILLPIALFAQTTDPTTPSFDFLSLFTTFAGYGSGILVITGVICRYILKNISTLGRSITSWVVALIIGYIGWFFQIGIFVGIEWWRVLVFVASFAAGSNVIYNVEWIRKLLSEAKVLPVKSTDGNNLK